MAKLLKQTIKSVSLGSIDEPKNVLRMEIDPEDLTDLAQSISEIGLLQPILLAIDGDRFEIVFGHRRYLAHKKLELSTIRAVVRQMSQQEIGIARATENIERAGLTPIEEAATYKNLIEQYGFTLEQVAKKMSKTPGTIKRRMDLLRMPPVLQTAIHKKQISITVAEELWSIRDPSSLDYYLIFAIENGCTKEVARMWTKDWKDQQRRSESSGVEGVQGFSPNEPRPVYVACDLCIEAMKIGEETVLRVCPVCAKTIKDNM